MAIMEINAGDTAWVMISAALVLLMTPGLALFYGGMVRAKGVLNMMMMSFVSMGTVGVIWVLYGYSMTFGDSWNGLIGNPLQFAGLTGLMSPEAVVATLPSLVFVAFQAAFAIIAVALISGAIAERATFLGWTVFTVAWATLVYFPAAHWVFAFDGLAAEHGGWIANGIKAIDFAGGTAIHINAGAAALALALVLGPRFGFGTKPMRPHNMTLVMLGAGCGSVGSVSTRAPPWAPGRSRPWPGSTPSPPPRPPCSRGSSWSGSGTVTPPRWGPPRASSPDWSRSPRPRVLSIPSAPS